MFFFFKKTVCKLLGHVIDMEKWERPITLFYQQSQITCKRCGEKSII